MWLLESAQCIEHVGLSSYKGCEAMEYQGSEALLFVIVAMICGAPVAITALIIEYKKWKINRLS